MKTPFSSEAPPLNGPPLATSDPSLHSARSGWPVAGWLAWAALRLCCWPLRTSSPVQEQELGDELHLSVPPACPGRVGLGGGHLLPRTIHGSPRSSSLHWEPMCPPHSAGHSLFSDLPALVSPGPERDVLRESSTVLPHTSPALSLGEPCTAKVLQSGSLKKTLSAPNYSVRIQCASDFKLRFSDGLQGLRGVKKL